MRRSIERFKAIVWLHALRLWRYRFSFINFIITDLLWLLLFLLGILLFAPSNLLRIMVKHAFWAVTVWYVISHSLSLTGGWITFFMSIGMIEEHMLAGISPFKVVLGRVITVFACFIGAILLTAGVLSAVFKVNVLLIYNHHLLIICLIPIIIQAISIGIITASISVRTQIPHSILDALTFMNAGLLLIPLNVLPVVAQYIYVLIPCMAPYVLIRRWCIYPQPTQTVPNAFLILVSICWTTVLAFLATYSAKKSIDYIKKNGLKYPGWV